MITCQRIKDYLDKTYPYKETLSRLSNNSLITSQEKAYDFDKIKSIVYPNCCSADALLIKTHINLVEFKTGFDGQEETLNDRLKKENLVLKIKQKASDSLRILDVCILDELVKLDNDNLNPRIQKIYCAVIDVNDKPYLSDEIITDIVSEAGKIKNASSYKTVVENSLQVYRKQTNLGVKLFYNEIFVIYDYEFDGKQYQFLK